MRYLIAVLTLLTFTSAGRPASAEPTRLITIPTATVLPSLSTKLNTDAEVSAAGSAAGLGLTGGIGGVFEGGADFVAGGGNGYWKFNAKLSWESSQGSWWPTLAVGGEEFGGDPQRPSPDIAYALASWTLPGNLRFTGGVFRGKAGVMVDENGEAANTGVLGGVDFAISTHWWIAADWRGGTTGRESAWNGGGCGISYATDEHVTATLGYRVAANRRLSRDAVIAQWEMVF